MSNSQLQVQEIEGLQIVDLREVDSSSGDQSNLNAKLLHHLVDVARVVKKKSAASAHELEELMKKNNELVNELLLSAPSKPKATVAVAKDAPGSWNDYLTQKLAEVDLSDEKVKQHADKQVKATAKQIDDLIKSLVRNASSLSRVEDKVTFKIDPKSTIQVASKKIYLRGMTVVISPKSAPFDLFVSASGMPADKSCKMRVEVTIKNQAGLRDSVRQFAKVFDQSNLGRQLAVYNLLQAAEYEDEALGFKKDGKLTVEVAVHADELGDYTPQTNPPVCYGAAYNSLLGAAGCLGAY